MNKISSFTLFGLALISTAFAAESDFARVSGALNLVSNGAYGSGCSLSIKDLNGAVRLGVQNGDKSLFVTIEQNNLKKLKGSGKNFV